MEDGSAKCATRLLDKQPGPPLQPIYAADDSWILPYVDIINVRTSHGVQLSQHAYCGSKIPTKIERKSGRFLFDWCHLLGPKGNIHNPMACRGATSAGALFPRLTQFLGIGDTLRTHAPNRTRDSGLAHEATSTRTMSASQKAKLEQDSTRVYHTRLQVQERGYNANA